MTLLKINLKTWGIQVCDATGLKVDKLFKSWSIVKLQVLAVRTWHIWGRTTTYPSSIRQWFIFTTSAIVSNLVHSNLWCQARNNYKPTCSSRWEKTTIWQHFFFCLSFYYFFEKNKHLKRNVKTTINRTCLANSRTIKINKTLKCSSMKQIESFSNSLCLTC